MDQAAKTMIENLKKNTGKSLDQWVTIVRKQNFEKHGQIIKFLKTDHSFTHGFANLVAHKARESDAGSVENKDELVEGQYKGKEHFKPMYDKLLKQILKFGKDVEVAPKKSYVSLRRKKQFACLNPATKSRFEIGLNIKGQDDKGKLQKVNKANAMFSHKIDLANEKDITKEVLHWLKMAYEKAG